MMKSEGKAMLLTIDIGNTNIVIGGMSGREIVFMERLETDASLNSEEYKKSIKTILERYDVQPEGSILSSVVPKVTEKLKESLYAVMGKYPIIVGPELKTGLILDVDDASQIGSDRIVISVAALEQWKPPLILFDLGTATTIEVVNAERKYLGGCIIPGMRTASDALAKKAAKLPEIDLKVPEHIIGKNTVDSMQSGLLYGTASMMDGMIERIEKELKEKAEVIATGGLAPLVVPLCRRKIQYSEELLLQGLRCLYEMNIE